MVRGGVNQDPEALRAVVLDNLDMSDQPVLSVHAGEPRPAETEEDTIARVCIDSGLPHGQVQYTTLEQLHRVGLSVIPDTSGGQAETHCHVRFSEDVTQYELERFVDVFAGPIPNPARLRK